MGKCNFFISAAILVGGTQELIGYLYRMDYFLKIRTVMDFIPPNLNDPSMQ